MKILTLSAPIRIGDDKIVVDEPSVVALDRRTDKMIAVGEKAKMMYEKTPIVVGRRDADRGDAEGVDLLPGNSPAVKGIFDVQLRCKHIGAFIVVVGVAEMCIRDSRYAAF